MTATALCFGAGAARRGMGLFPARSKKKAMGPSHGFFYQRAMGSFSWSAHGLFLFLLLCVQAEGRLDPGALISVIIKGTILLSSCHHRSIALVIFTRNEI